MSSVSTFVLNTLTLILSAFFILFLFIALIGLSLAYVIERTNVASYAVRKFSDVENFMTSFNLSESKSTPTSTQSQDTK